MLKKRMLTGAVLTALAVGFYRLADIVWVPNFMAAILAGLSGCELYRACAAENRKPQPELLCVLSGMLIAFVPWPDYDRFLPISYGVILAISLFAILRARLLRCSGLCISLMLTALAAGLFHALPALCAAVGKCGLLLPVLCCLSTDVAAYFIGRRFGKHKIAPRISPNKTVAGALGGVAAAVAAALIFAALFCKSDGFRCRWGLLLLYALTASVLGQIGDLSLSYIKRSAGIKDFGHILPGHGGILDRFDSLLYALPFTVCFYYYLPALFYVA